MTANNACDSAAAISIVGHSAAVNNPPVLQICVACVWRSRIASFEKLRHHQLNREKSQLRNIWDGVRPNFIRENRGGAARILPRRFKCPEFYPCYSLHGGYGPHGGSVFWGGFTQAGWAR